MKGLCVLVEHGPILQSDIDTVSVEATQITQITIRVHWTTTPAWTIATSLEHMDRFDNYPDFNDALIVNPQFFFQVLVCVLNRILKQTTSQKNVYL